MSDIVIGISVLLVYGAETLVDWFQTFREFDGLYCSEGKFVSTLQHVDEIQCARELRPA
jgi:hypothetical protein